MSPVPPFLGCGGAAGSETIFDLLVNQPAAGSVAAGTYFVATDTLDWYVSDGATWYVVPGAGSGYSITQPQVSASGANYAATITDRIILLADPGMNVDLPAAPTAATLLIIKDYTGQASGGVGFEHSITPNGAQTIEHAAAPFPIDVDNAALMLAYDPIDDNWFII